MQGSTFPSMPMDGRIGPARGAGRGVAHGGGAGRTRTAHCVQACARRLPARGGVVVAPGSAGPTRSLRACRCGGCRRGSLRGARAARRGWAAAGNPRSSVLRMHGRAARGGARARGREPVLRHSACDVFGERRVRVCSGHPVPRSSRAAGAADKCPFAIHSAGAHCSSRVWGHGRGPFAPPPPARASSCRARAPAAGGACHRCQQCLDRIPLGVHRDAAHGSARAPRTCPLGGRSRTLGRRVACKLETSGLPVVRVMYTGTNAALHGSDLGATSSSGITVGLRHGSDA